MDCTLCRDTGWLLECKDRAGVVTMEMIPCLIPDCPHSGKPIALMSLEYAKFTRSATHPTTGIIISLARGDL